MFATRTTMFVALGILCLTCLSLMFYLPELTPRAPPTSSNSTPRTTTPSSSPSSLPSSSPSPTTSSGPSHVLPPPSDTGTTATTPGGSGGNGGSGGSGGSGESGGADGEKRDAVRDAMKHAWDGYVTHAWGADDLKPVSKAASNWLGGNGATILDALSTLHIMGLEEEFAAARDWVDTSLSFDKHTFVSSFETNIRSLGGLMSAYDLSGDPVFLQRATDLGNRLLRAFDTPSGLPNGQIDLATGQGRPQSWAAGGGILSEMGTMQLEFKALSHATGDRKYADAVERVIDVLDSLPTPDGLYPIYVSLQKAQFRSQQISIGALGDSFYEYLLKQYLQTSQTEEKYRRMYDETVDGILAHLVLESNPNGYVYIAERNGARIVKKMDHLVCFAGGMLALGAKEKTMDDPAFAAGAGLTETCYQMYHQMASGIAPETVMFVDAGENDFVPGAPYYLLRPETVESIFIMHRLTHDPKYREWGWEIFQALERMCKVPGGGYSGLKSVTTTSRTWDDAMPSYFLAETLKYLYLLFAGDDVIPLDEYVFNTEAHPLKIWRPVKRSDAQPSAA